MLTLSKRLLQNLFTIKKIKMVKKGKIVKNSSLLQTINNINDTVVIKMNMMI